MRWQSSKSPLDVFCKEHCIGKSTLYKWCKRFKIYKDQKLSSGFARLRATPKRQTEQEKIVISFNLNNGTTLSLASSFDQTINLIQELSHAATVVR